MSGIRFVERGENDAVTENPALIAQQTAENTAPIIRGSGIYRISWRRTQDGWKMSHRILFIDSFGN